MIRIVLVISNLEYGGAQRQVVELANHMDPARFEVHVVSLSDYLPLAEGLRRREGRVHVVRKALKFDATVPLRLAKLLRRLKADVVHGYLFDAEVAARVAGRLAGTPLVIGSERNTDYALKRRQLLVYRLTRGCVDVIIANSSAGAAFNSRTLGMDMSRYRVVHNGVDTTRFKPQSREAIRRELGLAEDEPVVGMFASFKQQKNHPLLFAAARRVLDRMERARFLFVGEQLWGGMHGSDLYRQEMDRLVDALRLRERCVFAGNRDDVERVYPACDVTVLPSLFEGTPNVLLESMACGVPVVATDVSDNARVAPDGRVGYIVPLGDEAALAEKLLALLGDADLRQRMGTAARTWIEQEFSSERLAEKTAAVYLEGLERRCGREASAASAVKASEAASG